MYPELQSEVPRTTSAYAVMLQSEYTYSVEENAAAVNKEGDETINKMWMLSIIPSSFGVGAQEKHINGKSKEANPQAQHLTNLQPITLL